MIIRTCAGGTIIINDPDKVSIDIEEVKGFFDVNITRDPYEYNVGRVATKEKAMQLVDALSFAFDKNERTIDLRKI